MVPGPAGATVTTSPVFLVGALPPVGPYRLDGDEGRHAALSRRLRAGERITLTDGTGGRAESVVTASDRAGVDCLIETVAVEPPPRLRITLVQALPKGDRSELAVEQATEAGVDAIVPWSARHCIARWDGDPAKAQRGRDRWQRAVREATKQSRRSWMPLVHPLSDTAAVGDRIAAADAALVLHETGTTPIASVPLPAAGDLVLVIGPEGGLADEEVESFMRAGAAVVRLGPHVLRTSTAAAVALGALGVLTDRWDR